MRKFSYSVILCVLLFCAKGQTPPYYPLPDSNVVWNFHRFEFCTNGQVDQDYSIVISGDTTINSLVYHKLSVPYSITYTIGVNPCWVMPIGYKGAIRQDTSLRKVFFIPPATNVEQLLYDFNMQVGDTVKGFLEDYYGNSPHDKVLNLDSVLIGTSYRKRWFINSIYNIYLIEGIGSTYGLVQPSPGNIYDFDDYRLTCFQNNQSVYPDTLAGCFEINGIKSFNKGDNRITVFPNPAITKIYIEGDDVNEVKLFDLLGNELLIAKEKQIDIVDLPNAIYFVRVKISEGTLVKKIIVQH